jgi:two-component system response regulator VicR
MNKKKILVIEDDNILQKAIISYLKDEGFEVINADDGEKGYDLAKKEKPDLILLDLILPKKSGVVVLKEIRNTEEINDTPILIFTVYENKDVLADCVSLGIQGYFFKSAYTLEEIVTEIKKNLGIS